MAANSDPPGYGDGRGNSTGGAGRRRAGRKAESSGAHGGAALSPAMEHHLRRLKQELVGGSGRGAKRGHAGPGGAAGLTAAGGARGERAL